MKEKDKSSLNPQSYMNMVRSMNIVQITKMSKLPSITANMCDCSFFANTNTSFFTDTTLFHSSQIVDKNFLRYPKTCPYLLEIKKIITTMPIKIALRETTMETKSPYFFF